MSANGWALLCFLSVTNCRGGGWTGSGSPLTPGAPESTPGQATPPVVEITTSAASLNAVTRVIDSDFADPCVLVDQNTYIAFATNTAGINIPMRTSTNLKAWSAATEALPALPGWATQSFGFSWAPSVIKIADGDYRMVFSAQHAAQKVQCLGVARAAKATGPYTSVGTTPLQCSLDAYGSLDGAFVRTNDGQLYVVFKTNGPSTTQPQIFIQPMSSDGLSVTGQATGVLSLSYDWEGNVLEGPFVLAGKSQFFMVYATNVFSTPNYATGAAVASSLLGPYTKHAHPALASTAAGLIGPGGAEIFAGLDGNQYMSFHGWDSAAMKYRAMYIAPVALLVQNGNLPVGF